MCGIAGVANFQEPVGLAEQAAVERMAESQIHRGPDGGGIFFDDHVVLGHRRLSIIDVSDDGKQPMSNETGSIWVTFNGEIYNYRELRQDLQSAGHRFQSASDTEVLVHGYEQWGETGLLRKLRGMFAFAIYDGPRRKVIVARDRLGIKPLYYAHDAKSGRLAFASEVKALAAAGVVESKTDRKALSGFLLFGSVPSPRTILTGVLCLNPGHYMVFDAGGLNIERYWDLDYSSAGAFAPEALTETLLDSTRRHLVSDVPLGVFLSGGVDSAGLVALSRHFEQRLKTLTISFTEAEYSEAPQAREIANHFETEHHELRVSSQDFIQELPKILQAMDQPTNDGVNTYFVARAAKEAGLTVVLSGAGGDELFWGYPHYHWLARNQGKLGAFASAPEFLRRIFVGTAVAAGRLRGRESWMRLGALRSGPAPEGLYMAFRGFFASPQAQRLLGNSTAEMNGFMAEALEEMRGSKSTSRSAGVNYIEFKRYLHDQLLRDTDVFGMAHSIEVRVPYLDDEVVSLAARLPGELKMSAKMNKPLLVAAIGDAMIEEAARRPKRGFSFPMANWMKERTSALREMAMATNILERDEVGQMWSAFEQGRLHWSRAWSLVVLGARA